MSPRSLSVVPSQPAQQVQPQQVPIMPIPTLFGVVQAPDPEGNMCVVLQAQTPLGTFAFMVTPALAVQLAAQLHRFGSAGELVVPG